MNITRNLREKLHPLWIEPQLTQIVHLGLPRCRIIAISHAKILKQLKVRVVVVVNLKFS